MHGRFGFNVWSNLILSLLLVAANVGAPFRTALGRSFLDGPSGHIATISRVRVRVTANTGASCGFRVVVGISGGGADASDAETASRPYPARPLRSAGPFPLKQVHALAMRPVCPLRC